MSSLLVYAFVAPISLAAIIMHELSHGLVSYWLGDPTPKRDGRLSLNPFKHIDWFGLLALILFHVGWAKPVQINPSYYKKPKLGVALVSLAGPLMNLLLAFLFSIGYALLRNTDTTYGIILFKICYYSIIINVGLGVFNLIPLPPLDGSKVLGALLPDKQYYRFMSFQRYGMFFLIGLIVILDVLQYLGLPNLLSDAVEWIASLFTSIWIYIFK